MAWPDDSDLPVEVTAAFGADLTADPATWSWTDLSSRLRAETIRIRVGKSSGARQVSPGTCTVTLVNDDSALTPLHPISPYWPNVELGTPLRVRVQWAGVWYERFSGFADQWEPTYVPTGVVGEMASAVRVTCSGILRRLQQGEPVASSAMRRTITASGPVAYWPAEDGATAGQAGAALAGGPPLVVSGSVDFEASSDYNTSTVRYGTSRLGDLAGGGSLSAQLRTDAAMATQTAWTVHVFGQFDVAYSAGDIVLMEWTTPGGTYTRWQLVENKTTLHTQVIAYTPAGTATVAVDRTGVLGGFRTWVVSARQNGVNIEVSYRIAATEILAGTIAGTLAGVASMTVNPTRTTSTQPMPFGHLAVWASATLPYGTDVTLDSYGGVVYPAYGSYLGEAAHTRLARLCAEDGVPLAVVEVDDAAVQRMGWQEAGTRLELYQECVDVDGGLLYEQGYGLGYLPRSARYNPPIDLSVDLSTYAVTRGNTDPLVPIYDDQDIRNRWTVERREGSFVVADDTASQRRGVYPDSDELNVATDGQLTDQAGWRLHLSTVVDLREQTFPIDLAANPGLVAGWLSCGVGSRIVRTTPPAQYRPGPIDRLVEGWTETIGPRSWTVQVTPSAASPWQVAEADGEQRAPADGTVTVGLPASVMTMLISSTPENGVWTEDPSDFPLDVRVGGERVTAASIERSLVDTFTRTVAEGWGGVWGNITAGSASAASVNGSEGLIAVSGVNVEYHITTDLGARTQDVRLWVRVPVTPTGAPINAGLLLRHVDSLNYIWVDAQVGTDSSITLRLIKRLSGVATVLGSVATGVTHSTSVPLAIRAEVSGSLLRARVWPTSGTDPTSWQATVVDDALPNGSRAGVVGRLMTGNTNAPVTLRFDNVSVQQPQLVTLSARGVDGVSRAWPAGTEVDVWAPAIAPL